MAAGLGVSVLPGLAADTVPQDVKWLRVRDPALVQRRQTVLVTAADRSAGVSALIRAMHEEMTGFGADPAATS